MNNLLNRATVFFSESTYVLLLEILYGSDGNFHVVTAEYDLVAEDELSNEASSQEVPENIQSDL